MFLRNKAQIISQNVSMYICLCKKDYNLIKRFANFISQWARTRRWPSITHAMGGRCSLVCRLQVYLVIDELIACEIAVETVIWKTFWIAVDKSTLQLFYGNNENMQTVGTTRTSTFIMKKLKCVIWLVWNFNHFSKVSTSPFLPSFRGTLWLLWAGSSL